MSLLERAINLHKENNIHAASCLFLYLIEKNPQFIHKIQEQEKYEKILNLCETAIKTCHENKGVNCIEVGKCYAFQASCYRELKRFNDALGACENAIEIFCNLTKSGAGFKEAELSIIDYHECLAKSGLDDSTLYNQRAVQSLYKEKHFHAASILLRYLIEKCPLQHHVKKGNYYSTLASSYRDSGLKEEAIKVCQLALKEFNAAPITKIFTLPKKQELIKSIIEKLEKLEPPATLRKVI